MKQIDANAALYSTSHCITQPFPAINQDIIQIHITNILTLTHDDNQITIKPHNPNQIAQVIQTETRK